MNVGELIDFLESFDRGLPVYVADNSSWYSEVGAITDDFDNAHPIIVIWPRE